MDRRKYRISYSEILKNINKFEKQIEKYSRNTKIKILKIANKFENKILDSKINVLLT
jgi:hypothetical protein